MNSGNAARAAGLVITTSIATAAIAAGQWAVEFKVCFIIATVVIGAFML